MIEIIKTLVSVASDPLTHVLIFGLVCICIPSLRKWWTLSIVYLVLMATPAVHKGLVDLWAVPDSFDAEVTYDAAVLLLGVVDYKWHSAFTPNDRRGYCNLNQNSARVGFVLRQLQEGNVARLLLGKNMIGDFDETACVVDLLRQQGIDPDRIVIFGKVKRTLDEIQALNGFLAHSQSMRVLMVTSSNHMRRALAFAQQDNLAVDNYSTGKLVVAWEFGEFLPQSQWLEKNRDLIYEILAYIGYKISGEL